MVNSECLIAYFILCGYAVSHSRNTDGKKCSFMRCSFSSPVSEICNNCSIGASLRFKFSLLLTVYRKVFCVVLWMSSYPCSRRMTSYKLLIMWFLQMLRFIFVIETLRHSCVERCNGMLLCLLSLYIE